MGRTESIIDEFMSPGETFATESNQNTANTLLTAISGKLPATLGQKVMAASFPVVLASDQPAVPVSISGATLGYAVKITVSGTTTYVGKAAAGSAQASALWQVMKIDESSGLVLTWADGNTNFDNVATDLTALNYS